MYTRIRKEPVTAEEKKKLRFVLKTRLIIGAFFCPLVILGFILMGVML